MLLCVGEILERVCRRRMEEILDYEQACPAKGARAKICAWPSATIQRDECLCAVGRDCAHYPFALANSSSTTQTACELLLSHDVCSRALADVEGKFVFAVPLMEFVARNRSCHP